MIDDVGTTRRHFLNGCPNHDSTVGFNDGLRDGQWTRGPLPDDAGQCRVS
jgi:hypothetical protein